MLLNSNYSNFLVTLPVDFFPDSIKEKYTKVIKKIQAGPFDDLQTFINWSIQSISWPEITATEVEQGDRNTTKSYKGGWDPHHYATREVDITFKTTESYLNYFILLDLFTEYWGNEDPETYRVYNPDLLLHLLDSRGFITVTYKLNNLVLKGISPLELSYASNVPEYKTFSLTFKYQDLQIVQFYD